MRFNIAAVLCAALILAGCNSTVLERGSRLKGERNEVVEASIIPGHQLTWGPFIGVDGHCRKIGQARASIVQQPRLGTAKVLQLDGEIVFADGQERSECNGIPARGTSVRYRPKPGNFGNDQFKFRLVFPDREVRDITINIHIPRE